MSAYILAIDQSTTATKAILFDEQGSLVERYNAEHQQIYPKHGWVEHDPLEIYDNTVIVIKNVIAKAHINKNDVAAIAITNQRETTILWDKNGQPVYNAIVWQCSRAADIIKQEAIIKQADYIQEATGIKLSPSFSSSKAKWMFDNLNVAAGTLFGTMDSWLVWKLTGNHMTDYSNASRTQLFNINKNEWDSRIIDTFGLSGLLFPKVKSSNDIFGFTTVDGFFDTAIPVSGVIGDSHGALFGQKCFAPGEGKATFGTGTSIMINIGDTPKKSRNGLITSIAWALDGVVEYVYEGNIYSSGDTIKWLVEGLGIMDSAGDSEEMAKSVADTDGVYLVPAFHGLGAPHWDYDCHGLICGIKRDTTKNHIARAGLESIAYQMCDIISAVAKDTGKPVRVLNVDGGATYNRFLMQFVSDILQTKLVKAEIEELSAQGSMFAAGLAVGFWSCKEEIAAIHTKNETFESIMDESEASALYDGWCRAVKRTTANF